MGEYQDNLQHVAEPASPSERREARSTTIEDYEGLWFTQVLRGYAHYGAESDERGDVALAYAEYIDGKVRDAGNGRVTLYSHTPVATAVLQEALWYASDSEGESQTMISRVSDAVARLKEEE
jgi:hypothetical protein